jgi:ERCC4-related helicase
MSEISDVNAPSTRSVLQSLSKGRILELARTFAVALSPGATKEAQAEVIAAAGTVRFVELLGSLGRDELKAVCRLHGLDDTGRARRMLAARLLQAHGVGESVPPKPLFAPNTVPRYAPRQGDIVRVRHRQWLVETVEAPLADGDGTLIKLVCLDDDNQGRRLEVIWELELGAQVLQPEAHGLGDLGKMDPPRHFAAYLHALKWNSVTATDAKLFQSPFRAGIKLMNHQLTPLRRALSLPRANVFIADDVGLGKTIEAGLIAQELLLRQRVEFILIVCPASVCLQWRDEMQKKFGLHFEVMNRAFIGRRRQERGFGVNPWSTHTRFIVSHPILRRPEYRDPLLQHIGERATKSLLILDEAHVAAPAGANRYAVDSRITEVVRDIAPRFENRLFLSATPHNGHSNSFSALLEILDPQRFTRGVPVRGRKELDAVMIRRLKEDLRQLGVEQFPKRFLVPVPVGTPESPELALGRKLTEYTALMKPERGQGALVFINLQKRLLSSVEAFYRTLQAHHRAVTEGRAKTLVAAAANDEDEYGVDDDLLDEADEARAEAEALTASQQAKALLDEMLSMAKQARGAPDAKVQALLEWIRKNQCPTVEVGGGRAGKWTDRRVLIFTEYGDTKRYLRSLLGNAVDGTQNGDARIMEFHGGMSDEQREEVQRAFNSPPEQHPVRILIATDAAREGVNLQGHCADLFHFDVPWNPARIEQRNGRIDRTMQPASEVRCHYFLYADRPEDVVVEKLVKKVETIQRELGSLSSVILDKLGEVMNGGIDAKTASKLDEADAQTDLRKTANAELDRPDLARTRADIEEAGEILNRSRKVMDFDPALLRDAVDVGLELAGASKLAALKDDAWSLPQLPEAWQNTLDTLRPARGRNEPFWEFRKKAPLPVVFKPPAKMNSDLAHLHLQHPLVQRVLGRFLSQGYSAHDLSRITVVRTRHDSLIRVIAFGRLSLFGPGAVRLHDQLVSVAARWIEGKECAPFADEADRKAIDLLESVLAEAPSLEAVAESVQTKLLAAAPAVFSDLWRHIRDEADAASHESERKLLQRGVEESEALRTILATQRASIVSEIQRRSQLTFEDLGLEKREQDQWHREKTYMDERLVAIERELEREPAQIEALYRVALRRLEPVGLVFLWPETRG